MFQIIATSGTTNSYSQYSTFISITGIAFDKSNVDYILVADSGSVTLRKIRCSSTIYKFNGGICNSGPTAAPTLSPTYNLRRKIFIGDAQIQTKEVYINDDSSENPTPLNFTSLSGLASNPSNNTLFYIADAGTDTIYILDTSNDGFIASSPFTSYNFTNPRFLAADSDSNVYIVDDMGLYVFYYDVVPYQNFDVISYNVSYSGLAVISTSNQSYAVLYTIDKDTDYVIEGKLDGIKSSWIFSDVYQYLIQPYSVALDSTEQYVFVSCGDYMIYKIYIAGKYIYSSYGSGRPYHNDGSLYSSSPASFDSKELIMTVDENNDVYIASSTSYSVRIFQVDGSAVYSLVGNPSKFIYSVASCFSQEYVEYRITIDHIGFKRTLICYMLYSYVHK